MSSYVSESTFSERPLRRKANYRSLVVKSLVAILIIIVLGVAGYFYIQYQKEQQLLKNPSLVQQQQAQALIDKVSKLIELPQSEQPTIATVTDVSKLKNQPFFKNAKDGFKVLIYSKSKEAILYDPFANKIVEVGPINIGQSSSPSSNTAPVPTLAPVSVVIYSSATAGTTAGTVGQELKSKLPNVTVIATGEAKLNYTQTTVIDLTGNNAGQAGIIAAALNAQVGQLQKGENKPASGDILVILGQQP